MYIICPDCVCMSPFVLCHLYLLITYLPPLFGNYGETSLHFGVRSVIIYELHEYEFQDVPPDEMFIVPTLQP
jgi:hypothetical protein